jgi:hypothetical protein
VTCFVSSVPFRLPVGWSRRISCYTACQQFRKAGRAATGKSSRARYVPVRGFSPPHVRQDREYRRRQWQEEQLRKRRQRKIPRRAIRKKQPKNPEPTRPNYTQGDKWEFYQWCKTHGQLEYFYKMYPNG